MIVFEFGFLDWIEILLGDLLLMRNVYGDLLIKRNFDLVIYQRFEFLYVGYLFGSVIVYFDVVVVVSELCYCEGIDNLLVEFFGDGVDFWLFRFMLRSESVK